MANSFSIFAGHALCLVNNIMNSMNENKVYLHVQSIDDKVNMKTVNL